MKNKVFKIRVSPLLLLLSITMFLFSCGKTGGNNNGDGQDPKNEKHEWDSRKLRSEIVYESDGKECSKAIYTYDELGRETGYTFTEYTGLDIKQDNYSYKDKKVTYDSETHTGRSIKKEKVELEYYDNSYCRGKIKSIVKHDLDGKETFREIYDYDELGREVGYELYLNGFNTIKYYNYKYEGKKVTMHRDANSFVNGSIDKTITSTEEREYYDGSYCRGKILLSTTYINMDEEYDREEYTYDELGKEVGMTWYRHGKIFSKYYNYSYEGKKLTFYNDYFGENETLKWKTIREYY